MPFSLRLEVWGEKQVVRKLADYQERAGGLLEHPEVWEGLRNAFFRAEREQFESEGVHGSGGWEPLAPSTLRAKYRHGLDPRILHATNRLLRSLTAPGPDAAFEVTSDSLFMGTSVPYAIHHQKGTRHMGARKPVELAESDRRRMVRVIQAALAPGRQKRNDFNPS